MQPRGTAGEEGAADVSRSRTGTGEACCAVTDAGSSIFVRPAGRAAIVHDLDVIMTPKIEAGAVPRHAAGLHAPPRLHRPAAAQRT